MEHGPKVYAFLHANRLFVKFGFFCLDNFGTRQDVSHQIFCSNHFFGKGGQVRIDFTRHFGGQQQGARGPGIGIL